MARTHAAERALGLRPRLPPASDPITTTYVQQASPLLALPADVRNGILRMACEDTVMLYQSRWAAHRREGTPKPPGVIYTCKQMYLEALQVFYSEAPFEFRSKEKMHRWMKAISAVNLALVKHVVLRHYPVDASGLLREKARPRSLKLTIGPHNGHILLDGKWTYIHDGLWVIRCLIDRVPGKSKLQLGSNMMKAHG